MENKNIENQKTESKKNKQFFYKTLKPYYKILFVLSCIAICFILITGIFALASGIAAKKQSTWLADENKKIEKENENLQTEHAKQQAELNKVLSDMVTKEKPQPKSEGWDIVDLSEFPLEFVEPQSVSKSQLYTDGLILIGPNSKMPADYENIVSPMLKSIGTESKNKIQVKNYNVKLLPNAIVALQDMLQDAAQAGHGDYIIREAFRSTNDQTTLFDGVKAKLTNRYSGDILISKTKEQVNEPGTSDYQSGLSINVGFYNKDDTNITKKDLSESDAGKWLIDNCWKYGYIFRFPIEDYPYPDTMDKRNLTGVSIKLSVLRYVGKPAAAVMHLKNFVLEEFINYMIEQPHIAVYEDGVIKYEIIREYIGREPFDSEQVQKPMSVSQFESSYDNLGGIITSFSY